MGRRQFVIDNVSRLADAASKPATELRLETFEGLSRAPPSFATDTTAAYSDISFQLLSYALEKMTGKDFRSMVNESIIRPLNLTRTFYTTPDDKLGIIPGNRYKVTWAGDMGDANP